MQRLIYMNMTSPGSAKNFHIESNAESRLKNKQTKLKFNNADLNLLDIFVKPTEIEIN